MAGCFNRQQVSAEFFRKFDWRRQDAQLIPQPERQVVLFLPGAGFFPCPAGSRGFVSAVLKAHRIEEVVSTEFPLFRPERDRQKSEVFGALRSAVRMAMLAKPAVDTRIAVHSCSLQLRCPPTTRARGGR
jgi:hypothetical protein